MWGIVVVDGYDSSLNGVDPIGVLFATVAPYIVEIIFLVGPRVEALAVVSTLPVDWGMGVCSAVDFSSVISFVS